MKFARQSACPEMLSIDMSAWGIVPPKVPPSISIFPAEPGVVKSKTHVQLSSIRISTMNKVPCSAAAITGTSSMAV
jgi:hypothetical protein